jgi:hypothetical protein
VNATCVFEKGISLSSTHVYEEDVARRWWALPLNISLPLTSGERCPLIYGGRPGGSHGPDIRDVILSFTTHHSEIDHTGNPGAEYTIGDVEIHIRAFPRYAILPNALGTLLQKLFATLHKRD